MMVKSIHIAGLKDMYCRLRPHKNMVISTQKISQERKSVVFTSQYVVKPWQSLRSGEKIGSMLELFLHTQCEEEEES